jgi:DNA-directed RNA polymerase subunit RPC12/RpoP
MSCKCTKCGKHWSVSWMQYIPGSGYVCPKCEHKKVLVVQGQLNATNTSDNEIRKYLIATGSIIRHNPVERKEVAI